VCERGRETPVDEKDRGDFVKTLAAGRVEDLMRSLEMSYLVNGAEK